MRHEKESMKTYMHKCKTARQTDGLGLWWAVDVNLIVGKEALQLSSVYLLPFSLSACQFLSSSRSLADSLLFVSLLPSKPTGARPARNWPAHVQRSLLE